MLRTSPLAVAALLASLALGVVLGQLGLSLACFEDTGCPPCWSISSGPAGVTATPLPEIGPAGRNNVFDVHRSSVEPLYGTGNLAAEDGDPPEFRIPTAGTGTVAAEDGDPPEFRIQFGGKRTTV